MYVLINALIIILVAIVTIVALRGGRFKSQKTVQCAIFLGLIIYSFVISIFPLENIFYTFDSPDAVYKYMSFENTEIDVLVEGDKCDYVIGKTTQERTFSEMIIPKTDSGYKIRTGFKTKTRTIWDGIPNGGTVFTTEYGEDLFVGISFITPGAHEVTSNEDSDFIVRKSFVDGEEFYEDYYVHVSDKDSFKLYIDGIEVDVVG